jgi:uncharacterized repeat protein (TIGR01451 family)
MKTINKRHETLIGLCLLVAIASSGFADADLGITKTANPDPVRVGNLLTYHIAVTNRGPDAAVNVIVTDILSDDVTFESCAVSLGTWSNDGNTVFANLGNLAMGATAAVTIVCTPARDGVITNEYSVWAENYSGGRPDVLTTVVLAANRAPEIVLPGPHIVPVGSVTSFVVSASDADHDEVLLNNTEAPAGAAFDGETFSWTATSAFWNTTNWITFVANDQQGEENSIVTNRTQLIVPADSDSDGLPDNWEWNYFETLEYGPEDDVDEDGMSNEQHLISGTNPNDDTSVFKAESIGNDGAGHHIVVKTVLDRRYTIYFTDHKLSNGVPWSAFSDPDVGVFVETREPPTTHTFTDDEGADTTGGAPVNGKRFYRLKVEWP